MTITKHVLNPYAEEYTPFMHTQNPPASVESQAQAFIKDRGLLTNLSAHGLTPIHVTFLWKNNRELAEKVIECAHTIFLKYRTKECQLPDKLNKDGEPWKRYKAIILLGANLDAADDGNVLACELSVYGYLVKFIIPKDAIRGNKYFETALESSSPYTKYLNGTLWQNPKIEKDEQNLCKISLLEAARTHKIAHAQYQWGLSLIEKYNKKGYKFLLSSAEQGFAEAQFKLSELFREGKYVTYSDFKTSFRYLKQAADQGYLPALNNMGVYQFHGIGTEKSIKRACETFFTAASRGSIPGRENLITCAEKGECSQPDLNVIATWQEKSVNEVEKSKGLLIKDI